MADEWDIEPGTTLLRKELVQRFGGSPQGGIAQSTKSANVLIYTDDDVNTLYGYNFDGWAADGAFYYTGAGRKGDQQEDQPGNRAILNHVQDGRALRVFETSEGENKGGAKSQTYLGEFVLDPDAPVRREDAPGKDKVPRTVLVFRLLPVAATGPASSEHLADAPVPAPEPADVFIPAENNEVGQFNVAARDETIAERREAKLMAELERALGARGNDVGRLRLAVPGSSAPLLTDTFDATTRVLYEVKASSQRPAVREAIGQLLDYRRFVSDLKACTVVVPTRPADDLVDLVHEVGFELVAKVNGELVRITDQEQNDSLR